MANLDNLPVLHWLIGGAHPLSMGDRKSHGFFLIDMFAGLKGIDKMLAMQVLRGSDQDSVQILVLEH